MTGVAKSEKPTPVPPGYLRRQNGELQKITVGDDPHVGVTPDSGIAYDKADPDDTIPATERVEGPRDILANVDRHPQSQRFHDILELLGHLHDKKQRDYGRDDDPFANVRGSMEWGISAWVGAMVRAQDKIRRLQQYARKGTLANEGVRDAFMDLAVYAIIALVLWEEDE